MGAYGSPELGVSPAGIDAVLKRRFRRRRWPYFLAGMGAMLGLEFLVLVLVSAATVARG